MTKVFLFRCLIKLNRAFIASSVLSYSLNNSPPYLLFKVEESLSTWSEPPKILKNALS